MPSRQNLFFILSLLAALALGAGCSSSRTAGDDGYMDMGNSPESGADAVGSIPEDMLANDEASMAASEGAEDGELAAAEEASDQGSADPFADLTENSQSAEATDTSTTNTDALAVTETSDTDSSTAASGSTDTYEVKPGDTLMKIAFSIYGDIDRWKDLREWNQGVVKNNSQLKVGTRLTYEVPLQPFNAEALSHSYLIKQGDTLAGIADEVYGRRKKFKKLQGFNKSLIKNPHRIFAGFTIFYDITDQEMAEAEARRQERMAGGGGSAGGSNKSSAPISKSDEFNLLADQSVPSALSPPKPASNPSKPTAVSLPSAKALPSTLPSTPIAPPSGSHQPIAPPASN